MYSYDQRVFRALSNSENGEIATDMLFHYVQKGNVLSCDYAGGRIVQGHLIGLVDAQGNIDMRYHQVNIEGDIMTGVCKSQPSMQANGKLRLYEKWHWTSGDLSQGESILEEV